MRASSQQKIPTCCSTWGAGFILRSFLRT
jgi:hypothetical protein